MAFDTNTITIKGAELLAAATAQDRLILDGCDATQTYVTQVDAVIIENRPTTPYSTTSDVTVIGSTDNHVVCRAEFRAGVSTSGNANTLYLFGHKASAPSDIYVIYVASAQTPFYIPDVSDVISAYEALFDLIYAANADSVTTASTSVFTTLAEFNLLKERTVTTHKEGDPTVGDDQTIRGEKVFKDYCEFYQNVQFYEDIYTGKNIIPTEDGEHVQCDIGSSTYYMRDVYTAELCTNQINEVVSGIGINVMPMVMFNDDIASSASILASTIDEYSSGNGVIFACTIKTRSIVPSDTLTYSLGAKDKEWNIGYIGGTQIQGSMIGSFDVQYGVPILRSFVAFSSSPSDYYVDIKADLQTYLHIENDTHAQLKFHAESQDLFVVDYNTSDSQYEIKCGGPLRLYSGDVGFEPSYDSGTTTRILRIGSIFMAWFNYDANPMETGETFHHTSSSAERMYFAKSYDSSITSSGDLAPWGYYVLLCDVNSTHLGSWALVQCVALDS